LAAIVLAAVVACGATPEPEKIVGTVVVEKEKEVIVTVEVEKEQAEETTFERAKREGIVRVGFANEAPFAFAKPDGTLSGEAVEIARVIFTRLGIPEMEGVLTEFGSLIPGLLAERFDAITVVELLLTAKSIGARTFRYLEPITMVGIIFFLLSYPSALLVQRLEARLGRHSH
jgi:ABC-type amino acid transport substrate-binding protein